ncbi:MAG: chorismate mutase [Chitinivibrionales bacterium]|nr:chorismate mutase [Chitinivibrionales bacterium]MBD3357757.1 chorismate mutase [Chitinivibrionales bacterium]
MCTPDLAVITASLEGLEETIILKLIDRAQFLINSSVYAPGQSGMEESEGESLFDLRLRYTEEMDALFGRYCVPEERPFNVDLPDPRRKVTLPPTCLNINDFNKVSLTAEIRKRYIELVPRICGLGDDGQYGSSVEHDIHALQAISRRIHYGALYVAEAKYQSAPQHYRNLIERRDTEALTALLTRKEVEEQILERISHKVAYLQAEADRAVRKIIDPEEVLTFYRDHVIPLTKKGEVLYLLHRS